MMLILRHFQPQDGFPNPRGDLSHSMNSEAIALANKEVLEATTTSGISKKRGQYKKLQLPLLRESVHMQDTFFGRRSAIVTPFLTATAYLSSEFVGTLTQVRTSPIATIQVCL